MLSAKKDSSISQQNAIIMPSMIASKQLLYVILTKLDYTFQVIMLPQQPQHWSAWELKDHLILAIMDRTLSLGALALHHDFTPKQKFGPDTMGLQLWHSSYLLQLLKKVCVFRRP